MVFVGESFFDLIRMDQRSFMVLPVFVSHTI